MPSAHDHGGSDHEALRLLLEPPVPAMPRGGSAAPTELQQRDSPAVTLLVTLLLTVGVGRMLLKCLFLLRRAILYCRERGMVAAPAWTSLAVPRGIPWQPEPARLHPVMGAIPPSPLGCQGCTPSSGPSSKTTHGAGLDTSPSRTMHYTGSQVPKQPQQDKAQAARPPQGHIPGASSTAWQVNGPISQH